METWAKCGTWDAFMCQPCAPARKPVTIITGGFGVGKTELIKHFLLQSGLRIACLMNDVADISFDMRELQDIRSQIPLVAGKAVVGGCICCTRRESFLKQMQELSSIPGVDHILVETAAVAEALHVAENFALMPDAVCLDTLIAVVDAPSAAPKCRSLRLLAERNERGRRRLLKELATSRCKILTPPTRLLYEQIRFANVIFINQCDQVSPQCLTDLVRVFNLLNTAAEIVQCTSGGIHKVANTIISTKSFSMEDSENDKHWFEESTSGVAKRCIFLHEQPSGRVDTSKGGGINYRVDAASLQGRQI